MLDALRERNLLLPTIITSAHADVPVTVRVMPRGALTVLEKPYSMDGLWDAMQEALKLDAGTRAWREECRRIVERMQTLADSEHLVLRLIMKGFPNKAIASHLDIGIRTVESRRRRIFKKPGADSLADLIQDVTVACGYHRTLRQFGQMLTR